MFISDVVGLKRFRFLFPVTFMDNLREMTLLTYQAFNWLMEGYRKTIWISTNHFSYRFNNFIKIKWVRLFYNDQSRQITIVFNAKLLPNFAT